MLNLKSRADRILFEADAVEEIVIAGKNFVVVDFSGFCYHSGGQELLEEYITKNGGIVRKSAVKNIDYVIVCPVRYKATANYKKPFDNYEKAQALKKSGKEVVFISDLDFFVYFKLFAKLRVENKLRVADVYLSNKAEVDEKTAQKIEKFITEKKDTFKYKEYFDQPMGEYTGPYYDK